jgi:hypothetical protein
MVSPKLIAVFRLRAIAAGAAALSLPFISSPAHAFSFTGFNFTTNFTTEGTTNTAKNDIRLNSVTYGTTTESSFNLVTSAKNFNNNFITPTTPGTPGGPMSSDRGDNANGIIGSDNIGVGPAVENPGNDDLKNSLGNRNLNSIIDTEDSWSGANAGKVASIDVFFTSPTNRFFFWERGMNSDLQVQALGSNGELIEGGAAFTILRSNWQNAGFSTNTLLSNTTEIGDNQRVGAYGLVWNGGMITGLRLSAASSFNGPDFKVVASPVPEPLTILGSGIALAFGIHAKRKLQSSSK